MTGSRILLALLLLAVLAIVVPRTCGPAPSPVPGPPDAPGFRVDVARPWAARPFLGLLPGSPLRFDSASPGAAVVHASPGRLELRADGWRLLLAVDAEGALAANSRLRFPIELAERARRLDCAPARRPVGRLRVTERPDGRLDGSFRVDFPTCADAETGKPLEWPPGALTVTGEFRGLTRTE